MTTTAHAIIDQLNGVDRTRIRGDQPGGTYGSAALYRQHLIIADYSGKRSIGGYLFPDGSLIRSRQTSWPPDEPASTWFAYDKEAADRIMTGVKANDIGLTRYRSTPINSDRDRITHRLAASETPCTVLHLTRLIGMGGHATVITYQSPTTHRPVTALIIPHEDIDSFDEEEYYFEGMDAAEAQDRNWMDMYDQAQRLRGSDE